MKKEQTTNDCMLRRRVHGALAVLIALTAAIASIPAQAQSYSVLHRFTGAGDGASPYAGLTIDSSGSLYGSAYSGGSMAFGCDTFAGCGTVFKLTHLGSGWTLSPIYTFQGIANSGGANPTARVVFGPDGALYGTTSQGGQGFAYGSGTVFHLRAPATACKTVVCSWTESILYQFQGSNDGSEPGYGDIKFDRAGNLYGTTVEGGGGLCNDGTCGTVYELSPSGGGWTESILYRFSTEQLGYWPYPGVIFDSSGNLYGATTWNFSTVFELSPSGGGWSASPVYAFTNYSQDGTGVAGGLIFDQTGNLYGTTSIGGPEGGGTVFKLSPSGSTWTLTTIHSFAGNGQQMGSTASLTMDAGGNLYGITNSLGSHGYGNVFKLSPSGGGWTYTSLYDFSGGSDGGKPYGQVILDASGNIYGTTTIGGNVGSCYQGQGCGVVFKITL